MEVPEPRALAATRGIIGAMLCMACSVPLERRSAQARLALLLGVLAALSTVSLTFFRKLGRPQFSKRGQLFLGLGEWLLSDDVTGRRSAPGSLLL